MLVLSDRAQPRPQPVPGYRPQAASGSERATAAGTWSTAAERGPAGHLNFNVPQSHRDSCNINSCQKVPLILCKAKGSDHGKAEPLFISWQSTLERLNLNMTLST